jgi:hypothetical protein
METYDYEEGRKINEKKMAIIEDSLTRSLLYDRDISELSSISNHGCLIYYGCLIYITIVLTFLVSIIVLINIFKSIKN